MFKTFREVLCECNLKLSGCWGGGQQQGYSHEMPYTINEARQCRGEPIDCNSSVCLFDGHSCCVHEIIMERERAIERADAFTPLLLPLRHKLTLLLSPAHIQSNTRA